MFFKVTNGVIQNSRTPIAGGFEQVGLTYEFDVNRLVIVSDTELRDMTQGELDALNPSDPIPDLRLAYRNARNATDANTKAAFVALEALLKEMLGQMSEEEV